MSHPLNTQFLETAAEDFDKYLSEGDLVGMKAVVSRLEDGGFQREADSLAETLEKAKANEKLDEVEVDTLV